MPHQLILDLTDTYAERLQALARARNKTPEACILDFIAACQPGGSGWKPPSEETKKKPAPPAEPAPPPPPEPEKVVDGRRPDAHFLYVAGSSGKAHSERALLIRGRDGQLDAPKLRQALAVLHEGTGKWKDHPRRAALIVEATLLLASLKTLPKAGP